MFFSVHVNVFIPLYRVESFLVRQVFILAGIFTERDLESI